MASAKGGKENGGFQDPGCGFLLVAQFSSLPSHALKPSPLSFGTELQSFQSRRLKTEKFLKSLYVQ